MADTDLALERGSPVRTTPFPAPGPDVEPEDGELVAEIARSGHLWRVDGTHVNGLEAAFAELHGVPAERVVASTSGTAALHLAVGAVNPEPGDEIIVPPITDFGTVIPVLAQNAVPVFADVRPNTFCIDPESVVQRLSPRTRAIVAVHLFGQPCDMDALGEIARARGIALIEDCAQAPLAEYRGRTVGTLGDYGCFSLQQSKHITAGEGGLTIVRDQGRAEWARLFADKGWPRSGGERTHLFLGMNYRMPEIQGAIARKQLGRLPQNLERRRANAAMAGLPGIQVPQPPAGVRSSYWMYPFRVHERAAEFARAVRGEGIPLASGYVRPLYLVPALRERRTYGNSGFPFDSPYARPQPPFEPGLCPVAEGATEHLCYLAWHQHITPVDVQDVAVAIAKVARAFARRYGWS